MATNWTCNKNREGIQLSSFDRKRIVVNIDKMNRNNLVTHGGYVKFDIRRKKSLTQIKGSTMSKMPKFK